MAETKEKMAIEVFQMHKDELTEAFAKIADFPRLLSRLYVKKVLSGPGRNTATVCELMGRKFQASFVVNLIEGEVKENHGCFLALIRVLKKETSIRDLGLLMEGVYTLTTSEELTKSKVHIAALNGFLRTVKKFIEEKGTDPWIRDESGNALVHYAAISGSIDLMEYLVKEHYCSPTSMGEGGLTPLHLAAQFNHLDMVKYLIDELEADPNFPDEDGNIALHMAARSNAVNTTEFLMDNKKCDRMYKNQEGYTPIHMASLGGGQDVFEYMVEGATLNDLSSVNKEGKTPLHLACQSGNLTIVKYLVENGCNPACKDGYMKTPLHYACQAGKLDVVQYLVKEKAVDVRCKDRDGHTPPDLAKDGSHDEVLAFLKSK
eukprot:Em0009g418a